MWKINKNNLTIYEWETTNNEVEFRDVINNSSILGFYVAHPNSNCHTKNRKKRLFLHYKSILFYLWFCLLYQKIFQRNISNALEVAIAYYITNSVKYVCVCLSLSVFIFSFFFWSFDFLLLYCVSCVHVFQACWMHSMKLTRRDIANKFIHGSLKNFC